MKTCSPIMKGEVKMFSGIKTSAKNKLVVTELTRKMGLGSENVVARIAYTLSLSKRRIYSIHDIQDSRGKEYSAHVLFGNHIDYYIGLLCQNYGIYRTDKDIPKLIKIHIDEGLEELANEFGRLRNTTGFDFVMELIEKGLNNSIIDNFIDA